MSRRVIGPFNRVEGDLEVQLEISDSQVQEAWVSSSLYRGFEQILKGKDPVDALVYVPRICGICSVSQSIAAASALADIQGLAMPRNGQLASNLVLACENVADHLTHFYLFFMPDFASDVYRQEPWYPEALARFKALKGSAAEDVLPARAQFMHLMGLLAGKWPHSLALQPGGTTRAIEAQEKSRMLAILFAFRQFLERQLYGDSLERVINLDSAASLETWWRESPGPGSDMRHFLRIADSLQLEQLGRTEDRFLSYGAYPDGDGKLFTRGVWEGAPKELDEASIREDVSHSWMLHQQQPKHPFEGVTSPSDGQDDGYSWCKAPRLDGAVMEVGALARQQVDGHPLIRDLVTQSGGNVRNRVIARLLEIARVVVQMEQWVQALVPKEPFCSHGKVPDVAQGYGMIEAARGSLGHWLKVKNGRILNYQIIAPTTWNFSPRDARGKPGSLELALVGAPVREGETEPVAVQHIVRSFDPCMVCTVH